MEIIAERTIEIVLSGEEGSQQIRVLLGKPETDVDGAWFAPYEVHGPGDEVLKQVAYGVDGLQALALAIHLLPSVMRRYERNGQLIDHGEAGFRLGVPSDTPVEAAPSTA